MVKIEDGLLTRCVWSEEHNLDFDELVSWAIDVIDQELENKQFR